MKIKQTIFVLAIIISVASAFIGPVAFAADKCGDKELKDGQSCCAGVVTSILSCDQKTDTVGGVENSGLWGILMKVINILSASIGTIAVGGIVYGSILYSSAGGDVAKVKKAKETIMNVAVGLVMYAMLWSFLNYIIPGGLF